MIAPGFISDVLALLLLLPPTRAIVRVPVLRYVTRRGRVAVSNRFGGFRATGGRVRDDGRVDVWDVESWEDPPRRPRRGRRAREAVVTDDTAVEQPKPLVYGVAGALSPMVRRIVADNPGMMTGPGTNTYLVGIDEIAVIDPGPGDDAHLDAIAGCGGDRIRWILLTHTHEDHSPGAAGLKKRTGAEILAFGPGEGRGKVRLDGTLGDGAVIEATEFHLTALHTPGHASNHLCYLLNEERTLFTGDHIMQGSTVVISPPDGDMAAYLASLERLKTIRPRLKAIAPGHGHVIDDPLGRDRPVRSPTGSPARRRCSTCCVTRGTATIADLVEEIYADVAPELHPVARRTVWAHLRKLADEGAAKGDDLDGEWSAT